MGVGFRPSLSAGRLEQRGREFKKQPRGANKSARGFSLAAGGTDGGGTTPSRRVLPCKSKGVSLERREQPSGEKQSGVSLFFFLIMFFYSRQGWCGQKSLLVALSAVDKFKLGRVVAGLVSSSVEKLIPGSGNGCADD